MSDPVDYDNLSDEEFDKMAPPEVVEPEEKEEETTKEVEEDIQDTETGDIEDEVVEDAEEDDKETDEEESVVDDKDEEAEDKDKDVEPDKDTESDKKEVEAIDYKAEYERLMGTFKANGREITPKSVEDVIRLKEMGAGFHEKMAAMKPAKAALKMLESNGLLDDGKLDFLIDVSKGKPEAITQLLKDHSIDPLNVDVNAEVGKYVPDNHAPSEEELNLDSVLTDIESSPNFNKTVDTLTDKWDVASRRVIGTNPQIIKTINEHMDLGIYEPTMDAVNYERSLGGLSGLSDLEAYKQIGTKLEADGFFKKTTPTKEVKDDKPNDREVDPTKEAERLANKKKAAPTKKSVVKKKTLKITDILDMPDDDFSKIDPKTLGIK